MNDLNSQRRTSPDLIDYIFGVNTNIFVLKLFSIKRRGITTERNPGSSALENQ